jgi:serine protease Do
MDEQKQPTETQEPAAKPVSKPASKSTPASVTPPAPQTHHGWRTAGLVFVCFVASFLGAWLFVQSGLVKVSSQNANITESRQKLVAEGEVVADVAQKVSPSVVSIVTTQSSRTPFGTSTSEGAGTGVIISKDGYILTNKHVIPDGTDSVKVVLSDGTDYDNVTVVGRDSFNDIAFLKINNVSDLKAATIGDSSKVKVGQKVIAIGNALGQYETSVTSGIISATGRPLTASDGENSAEYLENLFQTDAAINPGNSGGPLVDVNGDVIGINTAIAQEAQGIGFAIPINDAKGLIKSIVEKGKVERAYLGVRYVTITPDIASEFKLSVKNGAYIQDSSGGQDAIISGSPAAKAGLRAKDIITKVNGQTVDQRHPLSSVMSQFSAGDKVDITYVRDGKEFTTQVTLETYRG